MINFNSRQETIIADTDEVFDQYFRGALTFQDNFSEPRDIISETKYKHAADQTAFRISQFHNRLDPNSYAMNKLAPGMARFIFPNINHPDLVRQYNFVAVREMGLAHWLRATPVSPFLMIRSPKLIYFATDDPDDDLLVRMRCREYRISDMS